MPLAGLYSKAMPVAQEKMREAQAKAMELEDELEKKVHQLESLEEINQQMIADMTKRIRSQIQDCPEWKGTVADVVHATLKPLESLSLPTTPRSAQTAPASAKPGFFTDLFGRKRPDEPPAPAVVDSEGSQSSASPVRRHAGEGGRPVSEEFAHIRASLEERLEAMAVLKAQNRLLEANMEEMQQTMQRCLEEKCDEMKRKVCVLPSAVFVQPTVLVPHVHWEADGRGSLPLHHLVSDSATPHCVSDPLPQPSRDQGGAPGPGLLYWMGGVSPGKRPVQSRSIGKPTGVAVFLCIIWFRTQLILTACQIRYHRVTRKFALRG